MYTIIKESDRRFVCVGRYQDGTETWEEETLDAAVKSMLSFSKAANGVRTTKKGITFLQRAEMPLVPWKPF